MRPSDDDTPDRGDGDSLADGMGEVTSSSDPFGDELTDDTFDDDSFDDDTDIGDESGDDDGFGDRSGEPDGSVELDEGSDDDGTVLETDDQVPELEMVGHENSPFDSVGHLLEEIGDALFGDEGDGDEEALVPAVSPFDADPADVASEDDLDLTGDGVIDGADLHEATSVFDFGVSGDHHHHDVADG
jgi:hypothetical protein